MLSNSKRIKLLSSATSSCLNFTMPFCLEKPEDMDPYAMDPPQHCCHLEKAQETELFPNDLYEPTQLTDSKNARLSVFGLASINHQGMKISQKQSFSWPAAQQLCNLCAARERVYGATGNSPCWCDTRTLQHCHSTLHIGCIPSSWAGDSGLGRCHMTLNALYNLYSRMSLFLQKLSSRGKFLGSCYKLKRTEVKPKTSDS